MRNELGTGVLPHDQEQRLIADGYTYAERVFRADGTYRLRVCKGSIQKAVTDLFLSAITQLNTTTLSQGSEITL